MINFEVRPQRVNFHGLCIVLAVLATFLFHKSCTVQAGICNASMLHETDMT